MQIIGFHPAPGFGALIPGSFVLPQNPLGDYTPRPVSYLPHIGDILRSQNLLPWNPLKMTPDGGLWNRKGVSGCGCGCGGGCGMGQTLSDDLSSAATSVEGFINSITSNLTSGGIPTWVWIGGAAVLAFLMFSRPSSAEMAYSRSIAKARSQYPRRITKIGRASRAAYQQLTA
jgi:hypothetical protein